MRQQSIHLPGVSHNAPIPLGARVGNILATGGVDPSTNQPTQRPLCMYPYLSEYVSGDPDSLGSYACVLLTRAQQQQLTALN